MLSEIVVRASVSRVSEGETGCDEGGGEMLVHPESIARYPASRQEGREGGLGSLLFIAITSSKLAGVLSVYLPGNVRDFLSTGTTAFPEALRKLIAAILRVRSMRLPVTATNGSHKQRIWLPPLGLNHPINLPSGRPTWRSVRE